MLLGAKSELSDAQTTQFLQSGTMHLFAISGLHIGAIALALHALLAIARLPGVVRFVGGLAALWLFVEITGASPSAVRAFLMIALVELAIVLRRPVNPAATLALAALISLVVNPLQLFSASFQMSYGIVATIVLLGLPLAEVWQERGALYRDLPKATWTRWQRWSAHAWRVSLAALAIGVATTLVSTVSGVVFFQLFTPGGLLANLLLIPLSSLVIFAGFGSLLFGAIGIGSAGVWLNQAAALVIAGMEAIIAGLLRIPGFFWPMHFRTEGIGFAVFALVLTAIAYGYARGWAGRMVGRFWTPFLLTAVALVLAAKIG
jgi:competence protein ComEC